MGAVRRRLGTGIGLLAFFGGTVLFALGLPTRHGSPGWALVVGPAGPTWPFLVSSLVGPLLLVGGAIVGMHSGNFERYHRDYDPETRTIDSDHPLAILHSKVTTDRLEPDDPPETFVFRRWHLLAPLAAVFVPMVGFLVTALDGFIRTLAVGLLVIGGIGCASYLDSAFRHSDEFDYDH